MSLLQINIDEKLNKAIKEKAEMYDVPATSLVRIVLVRSFMKEDKGEIGPGNIFNAGRDNKGKGIKIDDIIDLL
ncbi:hypothetical protein HZC21_04670 [Candidatus Peregrinibacteria bacterium]|nr:hypothetical protein [Candidatus Peregrinibacteria bacterium]